MFNIAEAGAFDELGKPVRMRYHHIEGAIGAKIEFQKSCEEARLRRKAG